LFGFLFLLSFFSFFDPPLSLFPYSSSSLAFVELTVEFSIIAGSCDRNLVHRLVYNIDLHPLLGAVEVLGKLWQLINTIDVAFEGFGTCMPLLHFNLLFNYYFLFLCSLGLRFLFLPIC
jgi:hypothetical protein